MANALGQWTRVPAEPPAMFRNEQHQDISMWLLTCTDYFGRNSWQWEHEAQRIRYATSQMDGNEVARFALTYRPQMTQEIGNTRQEGYHFWHVFAEQALRRFRPTHEAVRTVTRVEEDFKDKKDHRWGGTSGAARGEKRKLEDSKTTVAAKRVKKQYTALEKAAYQKKKSGERKGKKEGSVPLVGEVKQWGCADAHKAVDQKVVDKGKSDNECTRCGMKNHAWKYCRKPVQVSPVYRGPSKPKRQSAFTPKRRPQVATLAVDRKAECSRQAVERPQAWAFEDDDIL